MVRRKIRGRKHKKLIKPKKTRSERCWIVVYSPTDKDVGSFTVGAVLSAVDNTLRDGNFDQGTILQKGKDLYQVIGLSETRQRAIKINNWNNNV